LGSHAIRRARHGAGVNLNEANDHFDLLTIAGRLFLKQPKVDPHRQAFWDSYADGLCGWYSQFANWLESSSR